MHSACGCSSITHICSSTESTVNSTIRRQVLSWPTRLLVAWKSIVNVPNQKVALLPKSVFFFHLVLNLSQWFSNRIAASYIEQCIIPLLFHNFEASQDNCSNPLNFNHLQCHFIVCKDTHKACIATLLMIPGVETRLLCMGLSMLLPTVLCVQMSLRTAPSSNHCTYFYAHLQQANFKCLTLELLYCRVGDFKCTCSNRWTCILQISKIVNL